MITSLTFHNFKGSSRSLTFQPLTVITGHNHAGKTAIFDAITVATLGYHPKLGKTNPATFQLASAEAMDITMAGHTPISGVPWTINRFWKTTGRSIKATTTGSVEINTAGILDPEAFIGAGPKLRLQMLATLAPTKAMDSLAEKCAAWEENQPTKHQAYDNAADWAEALEADAKAAATFSRAIIDRFTKTIQGMADMEFPTETELEACTPEALAAAKKRQLELRDAANHAKEKAREIEHRIEEASELETTAPPAPPEIEGADLEQIITATASEHRAANALASQAGEALEPLRARIKQLHALTDEQQGALILEITDAEIFATRVSADRTGEIANELNAANHRHAEAYKALTIAQNMLHNAQASVEGLHAMSSCPVCLNCGDGWREAALAHYNTVIADAQRQITTQTDIEVAEAKLAADLKDLRERNSKENLAVADLPRKREILHAAAERRALEAKLEIAWNDYRAKQADADTILKRLDEHTVQRRRWEQAQMLHAEAFRRWEADHHAAQEVLKNLPSKDDLRAALNAADTAENTFEEFNAEMDRLTALAEKRTAAAHQRKIAEEAERQIAEETTRLDEHTARAKEIRAAREEAIRGAYQPIIAAAGRFADGVMEGKLEVNDGELGCARQGIFVPFPILSGTERAIITSSIQAGLGGIVLLDETSRMTRDVRQRFVANLEAAIGAGELEQAILIDHDAEAWPESILLAID